VKEEYVLSLFERSSGEVEWILPVLIKIKTIRPSIKIIIIFSDIWRNYAYNTTNKSSGLLKNLNSIAEKIVYLDEINFQLENST